MHKTVFISIMSIGLYDADTVDVGVGGGEDGGETDDGFRFVALRKPIAVHNLQGRKKNTKE